MDSLAEMEVEVDGLRLLGSEAHRAYLEAVRDGRREALMARLLQEAVLPGMSVVDAGAFLGYFSLLAARRMAGPGHMHAFEPDPRDFPWLERNIRTNGLADRVTAVPKAVSDREGILPFHLAIRDRSQSSLLPVPEEDAPTTMVECVTLDGFLGESAGRVGVVKIDVEGAELQTLEGMRGTRLAAGPDVTMFVECNPRLLRLSGATSEDLVDRLRELGFDVSVIDEEHARVVPAEGPIEPPAGGPSYVNLYCTRA